MKSPKFLPTTSIYRVAISVKIVADEISAYDNEAARRYAREELEESRESIQGKEVDLGFLDGVSRNASFVLPKELEPEAELTDGVEEDPDGTMEQADFEVQVPASVQFDVEAPSNSGAETVLGAARELLAQRKHGEAIAFDTEGFGHGLRLVLPLRIRLVA